MACESHLTLLMYYLLMKQGLTTLLMIMKYTFQVTTLFAAIVHIMVGLVGEFVSMLDLP